MRLSRPEFGKLFRSFDHTAFRLEVRDIYNVDSERDEFADWLASGRTERMAKQTDWSDNVQTQTAAGKRFERVRVVTVPLTDYASWLVQGAKTYNNPAGEDIRYLDRADAASFDLPEHDFWLFDSRLLVRMHFDNEDRPLNHEVIDDPAEIVQHNYWRDVAWHHALRVEDFEAYIEHEQSLKRV